ncbi:MAG: nucleotidyltransferase family protein [Deltaproteobacteria bacterium]|nr:MAG: nucleotidyltransferase family protein [Deltaproteobacteria bacterium]
MKMRTLILCGGFGTRLQPYTDTLPKPLLPIQGKPILHYMLQHLARQGFEEVMINLHYRADQIESYCGNGKKWGLKIDYLQEDTLLGTAGTVASAREWLTYHDQLPCLVIYGDLLINQDFRSMLQFHKQKKAEATILVYPGKDNSIVKVNEENRIEFFLERPSPEIAQKIYDTQDSLFINGGIQILSPELIGKFPDKVPLDLPRDIYAPLATKHLFYAFPLSGYRRNIDSIEAFEMAQKEIVTYGLDT